MDGPPRQTAKHAEEGTAVHIGAVFPQTEIGGDPVAIRDIAQAAESLGYHHLLAFDHVILPHRPE
jgi:hypothetical protein